jgi:hypothetical protein
LFLPDFSFQGSATLLPISLPPPPSQGCVGTSFQKRPCPWALLHIPDRGLPPPPSSGPPPHRCPPLSRAALPSCPAWLDPIGLCVLKCSMCKTKPLFPQKTHFPNPYVHPLRPETARAVLIAVLYLLPTTSVLRLSSKMPSSTNLISLISHAITSLGQAQHPPQWPL